MSSEMKTLSKETCMDLTATDSPRLEVCTHLCLSDLKQIINLSVEETVSSTLAMLIESKMNPLRAEMTRLRTEIEGVRDVVSDFSQMNSQLTDLEKCVDTLDSSLKTANCTAAAAPDIKKSLTSRVENLLLQQLENNLHRRKWALVISGLKAHNQREVEAQQVMLQFKDHLPGNASRECFNICRRPLPAPPPIEAPVYIPFKDLGRRNLRVINTYLREELNITTPSVHNMPVYGRPYKKEKLKSKHSLMSKLRSPGKKVPKTNEMRKAPPVLPPRKTDNIPKPPARRKKEKKPPLPEKIHSDQEDNQFYEEMNQMTLNPCSSLPRTPKSVPPLPTKGQQNKTNSHEIKDDDKCRSFPTRKIPAIPSMISNDRTHPDKTSLSHPSLLNRPRIDPPIEKPTENPLNVFPWYHGASDRMIVKNKLLHYKMDGMYAVRNSTTKGPNYPYAVTLYHSGKTYNFPIRIRDSDKRLALGIEKKNEPNFETLDALIDYFNRNKIQLMNNQYVLLSIPLDRST